MSKSLGNKVIAHPGPIAERSNSLDRGRGDPSSNPGEGSYGDGGRYIRRIASYISQQAGPMSTCDTTGTVTIWSGPNTGSLAPEGGQ